MALWSNLWYQATEYWPRRALRTIGLSSKVSLWFQSQCTLNVRRRLSEQERSGSSIERICLELRESRPRGRRSGQGVAFATARPLLSLNHLFQNPSCVPMECQRMSRCQVSTYLSRKSAHFKKPQQLHATPLPHPHPDIAPERKPSKRPWNVS